MSTTSGPDEPPEQVLEFDQPLEVNATLREAYAALGIAYGEWVKGVDVTRLVSDVEERRKLLGNIVASLHVRAEGLGGRPMWRSRDTLCLSAHAEGLGPVCWARAAQPTCAPMFTA